MSLMLDIAKEAAIDAGRLVISMVGKSAISTKGSTNNLVTEADKASEKLICKKILENFPDHAILGEEGHTEIDLDLPKLWIVDPLDGTNNFAHSVPQFSVSIAYAEYGRILCGAVYDPNREELFFAERGSGAYLNDKKIGVSPSQSLSESIVATGFYYDRGALMENTLRAIYHLFSANIQCIRRFGSAALDLSWVACGRFDAYYEYQLSPWDFAAGTLILEEAGGRWSDTDGVQRLIHSKGILSSNSKLFDSFYNCVNYPFVDDIKNRVGL
jgi:myo-inositol-1(or 4)-monophosphatase